MIIGQVSVKLFSPAFFLFLLSNPEWQQNWKVCLSCALYCTRVNLHFLQPEAYLFIFGLKLYLKFFIFGQNPFFCYKNKPGPISTSYLSLLFWLVHEVHEFVCVCVCVCARVCVLFHLHGDINWDPHAETTLIMQNKFFFCFVFFCLFFWYV